MNEAEKNKAENNDDYHYDEDAEGHENQLEFDRDYATYDALRGKGLINEDEEEKVREDLAQDMPEQAADEVEGTLTDHKAEHKP